MFVTWHRQSIKMPIKTVLQFAHLQFYFKALCKGMPMIEPVVKVLIRGASSKHVK